VVAEERDGVAARDEVADGDRTGAGEIGGLAGIGLCDDTAARVRGNDPGVIGHAFRDCELSLPQHIVGLLFLFSTGFFLYKRLGH
jgi:hypothetical protein